MNQRDLNQTVFQFDRSQLIPTSKNVSSYQASIQKSQVGFCLQQQHSQIFYSISSNPYASQHFQTCNQTSYCQWRLPVESGQSKMPILKRSFLQFDQRPNLYIQSITKSCFSRIEPQALHEMTRRQLQQAYISLYATLIKSYETQDDQKSQECGSNHSLNQNKQQGKEMQTQTMEQELRSMATLQCIRCQAVLDQIGQIELSLAVVNQDLIDQRENNIKLSKRVSLLEEQIDKLRNKELGQSFRLSDYCIQSSQENIEIVNHPISDITPINMQKSRTVGKKLNFQETCNKIKPKNAQSFTLRTSQFSQASMQKSPIPFQYDQNSYLASFQAQQAKLKEFQNEIRNSLCRLDQSDNYMQKSFNYLEQMLAKLKSQVKELKIISRQCQSKYKQFQNEN